MTTFNEEEQNIEAILVIRTSDPTLSDILKPLFPSEDDITVAKRAVGGTEIKGWFVLSKDFLWKVLDFITVNRRKVSEATIIVGTKEIKITGFQKDDVVAILSSPSMQEAIKSYTKK